MKLLLGFLLLCTSLGAQQFQAEWESPVPDRVAKRMIGKSWNDRCPLSFDDLAYIRVTHWTMQHQVVTGELVVHRELAAEVVEIFQELYEARFPIEQMRLIDDHDADDERSMHHNNFSAFCFRENTTKPGVISKHGYGCAVDINPLINPYIRGELVLPRGADRYLDRTQTTPGMIHKGDVCYQAFVKRGWFWGGHFEGRTDYQHFEKELSCCH
jgi:hypothetical protein